jgi:hypothetical protein
MNRSFVVRLFGVCVVSLVHISACAQAPNAGILSVPTVPSPPTLTSTVQPSNTPAPTQTSVPTATPREGFFQLKYGATNPSWGVKENFLSDELPKGMWVKIERDSQGDPIREENRCYITLDREGDPKVWVECGALSLPVIQPTPRPTATRRPTATTKPQPARTATLEISNRGCSGLTVSLSGPTDTTFTVGMRESIRIAPGKYRVTLSARNTNSSSDEFTIAKGQVMTLELSCS